MATREFIDVLGHTWEDLFLAILHAFAGVDVPLAGNEPSVADIALYTPELFPQANFCVIITIFHQLLDLLV